MSFLEKAMNDLYDSVHAYVGKAFKTLSDRMTALEKREIPAGKDGAPGVNGRDAEVDYDRIGTAIKEVVAVAVSEIPVPKDGERGEKGDAGEKGRDAEVDYERIGNAIKEIVAEIPPPQDGKDGAPGERGEKGDPGKDADPELIAAEIEAGIAKSLPDAADQAIKALLPEIIQKATEGVPVPKDGEPGRDGAPGQSVDIEQVRAMVSEAVTKALDERRQKDEQTAAEVYDVFMKGIQDVS